MGDKITLSLEERTVQGKKVERLRREGLVPTIVYGSGVDPQNTQAPHNILEKVVQAAGTHTPVHLTIGTKKRIAMIKDVDWNVVKHTLNHVSFHAVKQNEPVVAEVPIRLIGEGESDAERAGLVVLQALERLEVKALPMDLPEALEVSVESLKEVGDRLLVGDINLAKGVEIVDNVSGDEDEEERNKITDLVVASVYEPSALAAANDAAGGDAEADVDAVGSDNGSDTPQNAQDGESKPGGKGQDEPKQSELDANKV